MSHRLRVRRKERGGSDGVSGNDYRGARFSIDEEKRKRTKQKRRGRDGDYEDEERDTETRRNAVYALSVIGGRGERPSMWRTCCRCSLPVERAPRALLILARTSTGRYRERARNRSRSRRRCDSRHAKSHLWRDVCEGTAGFRAMEIGESLATRADANTHPISLNLS